MVLISQYVEDFFLSLHDVMPGFMFLLGVPVDKTKIYIMINHTFVEVVFWTFVTSRCS